MKWIEEKDGKIIEYYVDNRKRMYMRREVGPMEMLNYEAYTAGSADRNQTCCRCQQAWISRIASPKICPRCKSPYWRTHRKPLPPPMPVYQDIINGLWYQSILSCADCRHRWKICDDGKVRPCRKCKSKRVVQDRIQVDPPQPQTS